MYLSTEKTVTHKKQGVSSGDAEGLSEGHMK